MKNKRNLRSKKSVFEYDIIMPFETKLMTSTFGNKRLVPLFEVTPYDSSQIEISFLSHFFALNF